MTKSKSQQVRLTAAAKVAKTPEGLKELERLKVASRNNLFFNYYSNSNAN